MINETTAHLGLPLPNQGNTLLEDVARLRDALNAIDAALYGKANASDITTAINGLLNGAPAALDTLKELADALGDNPNFAATIASQISALTTSVAGKMPNQAATPTVLGGIKVGANLSIAGDGTLSAIVGGGGSGLPAYSDTIVIPGSNGQTAFVVSGGYTVGQLEVYVNGIQLYGNGEDFTASDGANLTLVTGINTTDKMLLRKWAYLPSANALNKAGDTMTGDLVLYRDPIVALGAATKQYVDGLVASGGTTVKARVATTANITLSGTQTIDGIAVVAGDRVLVKNQTTTAQNGIYVVAAGAWSRSSDAATWSSLVSILVLVSQGTAGADTGWLCTSDAGGTLGTTAVTFAQATGSGMYMPLSGGTFTGAISVPAGATGAQAPRAQDVMPISGGTFTGAVSVPAGASGAQVPRAQDVPNLSALPVVITSANTTAAAGNHYVITSGSVTLTLPASPGTNDVIEITNCSSTSTPVVAFGTANLRGSAPGAMTLNSTKAHMRLQYTGNSTYGWAA